MSAHVQGPVWGQLTEWGHGFFWGVGVGAAGALLLAFLAAVLLLDSFSARYPIIVLDRRGEKKD